MGTLTRDQVLEADDLPTEDVEVPEWGGTVTVRGLSGTARNEYEAATTVERNGELVPDLANMTAKLVARGVIDADTGERLFTNKDVAALGAKSAQALNRCAEVIRKLSGMTDESEKEIEGNSDAGQPDSSTSSEQTQPASQ